MKQVKKLATAMAMVAGMSIAPHVGAEIQLKSNGLGDTLIFPAFDGRVENYFTISNNRGDVWVQGHLRFRGAAWSAEMRDFDVILSPGDVLVFRIADIDGDGEWEIDQSLDTRNFQYTGQVRYDCGDKTKACMKVDYGLVPKAITALFSKADIDHHKNTGYLEFIGEAVLNGMTPAIMNALVDTEKNSLPDDLKRHQTKYHAKRGTNAWVWADTDNKWANDKGLSDVPNVLSGTGFVTIPGASHGIAYNAEALVDFRTNGSVNSHRIENYKQKNVTAVNSVILHYESASSPADASPKGDYVYSYANSRSNFEKRIAFDNSWGPTLADGDDYNAAIDDSWDVRMSAINSIAEVENAIRKGGQIFHAYYFRGAKFDRVGNANLTSRYFAHFPTKSFYGEAQDFHGNQTTAEGYHTEAIKRLLGIGKVVKVQVWNITENSGTQAGPVPIDGCISPGLCDPIAVVAKTFVLGHELSYFDINTLQGLFDNVSTFSVGRVVLEATNNETNAFTPTTGGQSYPGLFYTFEVGSDVSVGQWRSMQR